MESYDYLKFSDNKQITAACKGEALIYSDVVVKINKYNFSQERNIVITFLAVYNFKGKDLKRRIPIDKILGITVSKPTDQFVIHGVGEEYDYLYVSSKRNKIIEMIGEAYFKLTATYFPIFVLEDKDITKYRTNQSEKKKDKTKTKMLQEGGVFLKDFMILVKNISVLGKRNSQTVKKLFFSADNIKEVKFEDFQIISVLGRGSFGKVCLVEFKQNGKLYAMKSIKKDVMIDQEQIENTLLEKKILQSIAHPFLVKLIFCFQTESRVFFVLDYLKGGELFVHLRREHKFSESRAKFYLVQVGLALQYLHDHKICYRDIKPENILLDEDGYIKMADFGLAKLLTNNEKALSICGTPEYVAPEILFEVGHNHMVDWWGFGILLYEMIVSYPPFFDENIDAMYEKIKYNPVKFPSKQPISSEAKDLITKVSKLK